MRCLDCDYDLSGCAEHRCPECGRAFEPNDPHSYFSASVVIGECRALLRYALYVSLVAPITLGVLLACKGLNLVTDARWSVELLNLTGDLAIGFLGCVTPVACVAVPLLLATAAGAGWRCRAKVYPHIVISVVVIVAIWSASVMLIAMIELSEID